MPVWAAIHRELRRKGVTLALLWHEYRAAHPEGFGYSWFCEHYAAWAGRLDVVMRQEPRAGEKLFVDYAGQTVEVVERRTGEVRRAQVFVAVLGAFSYTYAEATWTQRLADWIGSHARAFGLFGGVVELVVPDNLRSAVAPTPSRAFALTALGILRLGKGSGDERREAACRRALRIGSCSYKSIESILRQALDRQALPEPTERTLSSAHENIRGTDYLVKGCALTAATGIRNGSTSLRRDGHVGIRTECDRLPLM